MNTIIEVSSANADVKTETSLTTVMSPPINLTSPATLNFSEGFIDLRTVGNSGSDTFIIDQPIGVVMRCAFYELFNDQITDADNKDNIRKSAFDQSTIPSKIDKDSALNDYVGGLYAMYQVTYTPGNEPAEVTLDITSMLQNAEAIESIELIEEEFSFIVEPGTYSATTIVQYLNDRLQGAYVGVRGNLNAGFYDPRSNTAEIGGEGNSFYLPFRHFKNQYVEYAFQPLLYKKAIVFLRMDKQPMRSNFKGDQFAYYYPQSPDNNPTVMFGTPIASLQNTDGIISFAYLHNPVYKQDTSGNRDEFVQLNYLEATADPTFSWYWTYARGGVALTALEPPSFWEDLLGFDVEKKILLKTPTEIPISAILQETLVLDFINIVGDNSISSSTTRPYIGVSDIDNYVNSGIVDNTLLLNTAFTNDGGGTALQTLDITNTVALSATRPIQFAQFNGGGHYRIEIDIGYYVNNFNSAKTKKSIACLASREYLTNGFLSVFSGGQPIELPAGSVLSYIAINILDPTTGKPATDVGTNNFFYFSLTS
jgi:hypothetical protein